MRKLICIFVLLFSVTVYAQTSRDSLFLKGFQKSWSSEQKAEFFEWEGSYFGKSNAEGTLRQTAIMNGNKITTEIWNFGSVSSPGNSTTDIIWEGLGYGYEFGPLVAAEVPVPKGSHPDVLIKRDQFGRAVTDNNGDTVYVAHIISDGLRLAGPEISGDQLVRWGWQPLVQSDDGVNQFLTLDSKFMPTSDDKDRDGDGRPDSWPEGWYDPNQRKYVWPGALGFGATNSDKETFFVFDDRDNLEFEYFPYVGDSVRRGLGLEVEARYYQWSNAEAEDAIFMIYKIKNKGHFDLDKVAFGMLGDPHIGGPADYSDDNASFNTQLEMTFAWDEDNYSINNPDIIPGYLGYKFLESPGISTDGIDNDEDGMIDESWADGIDNDGDWNEETDDVGIDGIANTGDVGEKDGVPTAGDPFDITKPGEPNFEFTDIDESDMLGLTSFSQPQYGGYRIDDDERVWNENLTPNAFDSSEVQGDYIFIYGSGRFTLKSADNVGPNETSDAIKRFSIALIVAADRADLLLNADAVQRIYNSGYQFAKPPAKPTLAIVPGDRKVTLYWDSAAETSVDPISRKQDFEGYAIYRSTDPGFLDQQTITDINGNSFLFQPLKSATGAVAKFDLINGKTGPSPTIYKGRGIAYNLGNDVGLRHVYVDSNNVFNGQTYFYAVVSYDHGSDSLRIAPSECSKIITFNPVTNEYSFDVNTGVAIPRVKTAGYENAFIENAQNNSGVIREVGYSTGNFAVNIVDERQVEDDNTFKIEFSDTTGVTAFSVWDTKQKSRTITSFYENYVPVGHSYLHDITVHSVDETQQYSEGVDFDLDPISGSILVYDPALHMNARMEDDQNYLVKYTNYPIYQSTKLDSQLSNPIFDGIRLVVKESEFQLNRDLTGWSTSSRDDLRYQIVIENQYADDPYDYEFQFFDEIVDTGVVGILANFKIYDVANNAYMDFVVNEVNATRNGQWDLNETIFVLRGGQTPSNIVWQIKFLSKESGAPRPGPNDLFYLATDKPFANGDLFSFVSKSAKVNTETAKNQLDKITVVPNPYVATNVIEPLNTVSRTERGYRRLYFNHLPTQCTIRIYTTAGELVQTLEHNSTIDDGKEFWNLLSKDNMEVAYGLYFFHVDAPGIGKTIGKFVIIK